MLSRICRAGADPLQTGYSTAHFYNSGNGGLQRNLDVPDNKTGDTTTTTLQIKSGVYTAMSDKYAREDERLKTFSSWPLVWLSKDMLAMTGMCYMGDEDKVKCYFCTVEIGRWERADDPVLEHLRWSANCPLLRRRTTNNVPINADALDHVLPPFSYDVCGFNEAVEVRPHAFAEPAIGDFQEIAEVRAQPDVMAESSTPRALLQRINSVLSIPPASAVATQQRNNNNNCFPEYPEYAIETARVRSFNEWPRSMKQKPEQLAEAGFFYTGTGDRVKCFSCGGGLMDWEENDEPWEQHAQCWPNCRFLKLMKEQQFIDDALAKLKTPSASDDCVASSAAAAPVVQKSESSSVIETEALRSGRSQRAASATNTNSSTDDDEDQLRIAANSTAEETKLCKICYAGEYNTAFLPCGHVVACAKCASSVTKCPMCRKPFTDVMRVYFS